MVKPLMLYKNLWGQCPKEISSLQVDNLFWEGGQKDENEACSADQPCQFFRKKINLIPALTEQDIQLTIKTIANIIDISTDSANRILNEKLKWSKLSRRVTKTVAPRSGAHKEQRFQWKF